MQYVAGCIKGGTLPAGRGAPLSRAVCSTRINLATLTLLLKKLFFSFPPSSQSEPVAYVRIPNSEILVCAFIHFVIPLLTFFQLLSTF